MTGFYRVPFPINEPVKEYTGQDKEAVLKAYREMYHQTVQVPLYIGGEEFFTAQKGTMRLPHEHAHVLGQYQLAEKQHVQQAVQAALAAKSAWQSVDWQVRAAIFLKAAELIAGKYRSQLNAATMLAQSKTIHQAEIDAACELADFLRFNVHYMAQLYADQPTANSPGIWNQLEYRPLEGFIYAVTPFNFTAIAGNLPSAPAMLGNVVVWKPSDYQVFSANIIMKIFQEAGLPAGVINMVTGDPAMITEVILQDKNFAGLHYTGSTQIFKQIWKKIANNLDIYHNYPRIVGETGGKDFVIAHPSADPAEVAVGLLRGAFEFQGQKCSAASRAYLPASLYPTIEQKLLEDLQTVQMGSPEDFANFVTAVIHEQSFDKIARYIEEAKKSTECRIIAGGEYDKSRGYFIQPTVILTTNPHYPTMQEELFGPVLTIYVYEDMQWENTLKLVDQTSAYALTGAIFGRDPYAIQQAKQILLNAAGNLYINDKPTGAVVGQQAFGGARASGTNDKAGSILNLLRWVSPRTVKETFVPPVDYRYPFLHTK